MKQFMLKNKTVIGGAMALVAFGIFSLSFQDTPYVKAIMDNQERPQDTTKKKKNSMTMKEFDQLSEKLDKQVLDQLKQLDMQKVQLKLNQALQDLNIEQISETVEKSLKSINLDKMREELKEQASKMDQDYLNSETGSALAEAKKELEKASEEMKKINTDEIRKELEKAKLELRKSKVEMQQIDMDKIMQEAREGIDKAKKELKRTRQMFTEMEKDGLIDTKKGFKIGYKKNELFINGVKQSQQVADKYRSYFNEGEDDFEISIDGE